ncbi:MAG: phytoene desaturase family protein, partial [Clostridia bacterium]
MDKDSVVVIGAGLGGLSAAVSLAASGHPVVVLEKNRHFGGKLNELEDEGFRFDLGPSILTMPWVFEDLFRRADKEFGDYVEIRRLPLEWRSFFEDGTVLDLHSDLDEM